MSSHTVVNPRIVLHARPAGMPRLEDFRFEKVPVNAPQNGEVLLRTQYLSLDPYMRGRISDAPSYAPPVGIGETMVGGTVCRVEVSQHSDYKTGDLVLAYTGWQAYALSNGQGLTLLGHDLKHPSYALSVLGMPGFTAYTGLLDIGQPHPGDTVVVAAASGAVGSVVGQIAKLKGCRVIGIAGGQTKCDYVTRTLGLDACLDRNNPQFPQALAQVCSSGIDVYFENVGGAVFDAVLPLLNVGARMPLCGLISHYNDSTLPPGPDRLPMLMATLLKKRIKVQGFIIGDHYEAGFQSFFQQMKTWVDAGTIQYKEDMTQGLENAPAAFIDLLSGKNFGKAIVELSKS